MKHSSALKRKEIWAHATAWMDFEDITLNEKLDAKGHPLSVYHSMYLRYLGQSVIETENRMTCQGKRSWYLMGTEFQFSKMKRALEVGFTAT